MRRAPVNAVVALVVALTMVPALGEVFEAAAGVVHASGDAHAPSDAEHGCSGTFHFCHCCPQTIFAPVAAMRMPPRPVTTIARVAGRELPAAEAHVRGTFRPPRSA